MIFDYSEPNHFSVYCITSPAGLKFYSMTGKKPNVAWKCGHLFKYNTRLTKDINTYTFQAFNKEILAENMTYKEAESLLLELINRDKTDNPEYGYNCRRNPRKEDNYNVYVLTFSDGKKYVGMTSRTIEERMNNRYRHNELIQKAIERDGGLRNVKKEYFDYPLSRESAERIEATLIEYFDTMNSEKGYNRRSGKAFNDKDLYVSNETIKKLKKAGEKNAKPVRCIETGEVFSSLHEAGRMKSLNKSHILDACIGRYNTCGGYRWEFVEKN